VFDSGVGGLTVLHELLVALPHEDFLYLGDTARFPYGERLPAELTRFAIEISHELLARGAKLIVVACNSATAAALPQLQGHAASAWDGVEVLGVVRPGAVQAVAATDDAELADTGHSGNVTVEGYTAPADEDFVVEEPDVNANFFHAMQVPILAGRAFTEDDDATHPPVVIVNETFVKHYFSSPAAAVGRRVASGAGNHLTYMTIVGVTRDARHRDLRKPAIATLFTPLRQATSAGQLYLYLRTAMSPEQTFATVRQAMKQIDPSGEYLSKKK